MALSALRHKGDPFVKVELIAFPIGDVVTDGVVVKLNKERVQRCLLEDIHHIVRGRGQGALRGSGDNERLVQGSKLVNHSDVGLIIYTYTV